MKPQSKFLLDAFLGTHAVFQYGMWLDEGYFDFRWMSDPWNWVIYFIYSSITIGIQFLLYHFVFKNFQPRGLRGIMSFFIGFALVILVLWGLYEVKRIS